MYMIMINSTVNAIGRGPAKTPPPPWGFLKTYIFGNLIISASQISLSASNRLVGVAVAVI